MKNLFYVILSAYLINFIILSSNFAQNSLITYTDKDSNILQIQKNKITGSPHRIYGIKKNVGAYKLNKNSLKKVEIQVITNNLLKDYADILKIDTNQILERKIETDGHM